MSFALPEDLETISFLDREIVFEFHQDVLEPGQLSGCKSVDDLESALGRVRSAAYYDPNADLVRLAAYYWHGVSSNHAFQDGNKRTGFVCMVNFLLMNGLEFCAPDVEMGPLIERLFNEERFSLDVLDHIVRTSTRPYVG
ncbi:type II toxin-antitoxin system death-on-curing family toxin [Paracoccus fontiphilus]|uniref:Type II toxin-antitoxin system death-on-curing family toxin n=1 Tax=Paracoccus fontiphilus TaxID=1815556 RepID=A0ABV7IKB7_9RHOB|nr:type II toxin-antitoxin system death-on-curing family toxin [Paracoccus fontiphilus]